MQVFMSMVLMYDHNTHHSTTTSPSSSLHVSTPPVAMGNKTSSDVLDMPVDPNEPTYCLCHQVSFGEMIGCDNTDVGGSLFTAGYCLQLGANSFIHFINVLSCVLTYNIVYAILAVAV